MMLMLVGMLEREVVGRGGRRRGEEKERGEGRGEGTEQQELCNEQPNPAVHINRVTFPTCHVSRVYEDPYVCTMSCTCNVDVTMQCKYRVEYTIYLQLQTVHYICALPYSTLPTLLYSTCRYLLCPSLLSASKPAFFFL